MKSTFPDILSWRNFMVSFRLAASPRNGGGGGGSDGSCANAHAINRSRGSSPPGSSRRAGGYSPVLRLTADEMSLPYSPVPKSSPSGTRLYCRGGHFGSGFRAGPLADAPRPFSSCSPAAPTRKMRDRPAPWRSEFVRILRERYGIEDRVVAGCIVSPPLLAYTEGYNRVSMAAANRKFGHDVFKESVADAIEKMRPLRERFR